jgi:hypothetical protein
VRGIDAGDIGAALPKLHRKVAVAAAHIEHAPAAHIAEQFEDQSAL